MRREYFVFLVVIFLSACATAPAANLVPTLDATEVQPATLDLDALQTQTFATIEALPLIETSIPYTTPTTYLSPTSTPHNYFADDKNWVSPNEEYVAVLLRDGELTKPRGDEIRILDRNNEILQSIQFIYEEQIDPRPFIFPDHWSPDSHYLYYLFFADGEGGPNLSSGRSLIRLDILTGERVGMIECKSSIAWGFSKDDSYLAYICYDNYPYQLIIRDLETENEIIQSVPFESPDSSQIGIITWAPDRFELVFFILDYEDYQTLLYQLDPVEQEFRLVGGYPNMELYGVEEWTLDNKLTIVAEYVGRGLLFEIDLTTGEIVAIETPAP